MEKFFLCRFLTDNKLDIIDEEDVVVSVFFTELRGGNIVLFRIASISSFVNFSLVT